MAQPLTTAQLLALPGHGTDLPDDVDDQVVLSAWVIGSTFWGDPILCWAGCCEPAVEWTRLG